MYALLSSYLDAISDGILHQLSFLLSPGQLSMMESIFSRLKPINWRKWSSKSTHSIFHA